MSKSLHLNLNSNLDLTLSNTDVVLAKTFGSQIVDSGQDVYTITDICRMPSHVLLKIKVSNFEVGLDSPRKPVQRATMSTLVVQIINKLGSSCAPFLISENARNLDSGCSFDILGSIS